MRRLAILPARAPGVEPRRRASKLLRNPTLPGVVSGAGSAPLRVQFVETSRTRRHRTVRLVSHLLARTVHLPIPGFKAEHPAPATATVLRPHCTAACPLQAALQVLPPEAPNTPPIPSRAPLDHPLDRPPRAATSPPDRPSWHSVIACCKIAETQDPSLSSRTKTGRCSATVCARTVHRQVLSFSVRPSPSARVSRLLPFSSSLQHHPSALINVAYAVCLFLIYKSFLPGGFFKTEPSS